MLYLIWSIRHPFHFPVSCPENYSQLSYKLPADSYRVVNAVTNLPIYSLNNVTYLVLDCHTWATQTSNVCSALGKTKRGKHLITSGNPTALFIQLSSLTLNSGLLSFVTKTSSSVFPKKRKSTCNKSSIALQKITSIMKSYTEHQVKQIHGKIGSSLRFKASLMCSRQLSTVKAILLAAWRDFQIF